MKSDNTVKKLPLFEVIFINFSILYLLFAFRGIMRDALGASYFIAHSGIVLAIYLITLTLLFSRKPKISFSLNFFLLVLLILIASLSLSWSVSIVDTLNGLVGLIGVALLGIYIATAVETDFSKYLLNAVFTYVLITMFLYILGIDITIYRYNGHGEPAFQGFTDHKNLVGNMIGLATTILYAESRSRHFKPTTSIIYFSVFLVTLFVAKASTSIVALALAVAFYEMAFLFRNRRSSTLLFSAIALYFSIALVILLPSMWGSLLSALGENATLSSRTIIWDIVLTQVQERPILGFGFNAFWSEGNPYGYEFAQRFYGKTFKQAHNGFVELAANIGIPAMIIMIVACLMLIFVGHSQIGDSKHRQAFWLATIFIIFNNLGEANFFTGNYLMFSILLAASLILSPSKPRLRN